MLASALAQLSAELEESHTVDRDTLRSALFGPVPACYGVLALNAGNGLLGAALYAPVMSTSLGGTGAFVSDLWVAAPARGQALGPAMLAYVARRASALWQARFLRLVSYRSNARARAFYLSLGFTEKPQDVVLQLSGDAFAQFNG